MDGFDVTGGQSDPSIQPTVSQPSATSEIEATKKASVPVGILGFLGGISQAGEVWIGIPPPGAPELSPQWHIDAGTAAAMKVEDGMHQLCISMLDQWIENIQKEAEIARRHHRLDMIERQQQEQVAIKQEYITDQEQGPVGINLAVVGTEQFRQAMQMDENMRTGVINSVNGYINDCKSQNPAALTALPFMTASLVLGIPLLSEAVQILNPANIAQVAMNPLQQAMNGVLSTGATNAAALGLLGGLLASGAFFMAGLHVAASNNQAERKGAPKLMMHQEFARQMMRLSGSEMLRGLVDGLTKGNAQLSNRMLPMLQIAMLASALGYANRTETGKNTGAEVLGIIDGSVTGPVGKEVGALLAQLRTLFAELKSNAPNDYKALRTALEEYYDSDPAGEDLQNLGGVLSGVFNRVSVNLEDQSV